MTDAEIVIPQFGHYAILASMLSAIPGGLVFISFFMPKITQSALTGQTKSLLLPTVRTIQQVLGWGHDLKVCFTVSVSG